MMLTRDGRTVTIETRDKPGMSIFKMFGTLDGAPCYWTSEGRYRMDGVDDARDVVEPKA